MISIFMETPHEVLNTIAQQAKATRLFLNMTQKTLSERSGVSYGVIKKFERSGQISLESLLKIALALHVLEDFQSLFTHHKAERPLSIDALLLDKNRKRGRQ